jgi:sulfotransferase family protein
MKLIGAGLPRTATSSQKLAMDVLGVTPCYHMQNVFADLDEVPRWCAALEDPDALRDLLDDTESVIDWPGSYFWRELMDLYPEAKVLLSVRDGRSWARSMQSTIWGMLYGDGLLRHITEVHCDVDARWRDYIEMMRSMWETSGISGPGMSLGEMARACERHTEQVIDAVPSDRLLVWQITDGWEPLCDFLDLEVPDVPFPHINESGGFEGGIVRGGMAAIQRFLGEETGEFQVAHPGATRESAAA